LTIRLFRLKEAVGGGVTVMGELFFLQATKRKNIQTTYPMVGLKYPEKYFI